MKCRSGDRSTHTVLQIAADADWLEASMGQGICRSGSFSQSERHPTYGGAQWDRAGHLRRLVVPWTWHLGQLHLTIQAAFGWCDYHLHEFRIGGVAYGDPENNEWNDDTSIRTFDATELRLVDFAREPGRSFDYVYDFGSCWKHVLTVEELLGLDIAPRAATCIGGAQARPPEDVGGTGGYGDFIAIMAAPHDPEHRSTKRELGKCAANQSRAKYADFHSGLHLPALELEAANRMD